MVNKSYLILVFVFAYQIAYSQNKVKKDLYLFFEPNENSYKLTREQNAGIVNKQYFPDEYDVYGLHYIAKDKKREFYTLFFATINKNQYSVTDSIGLKEKRAIRYENVPFLKDIFFDTSDKKHFPYTKVFIIERITNNQFKVIEVQSYIGSDGFQVKTIK